MKRFIIPTLFTTLLSLTFHTPAASKGKVITFKGKGCCAKCCLKIADKCQNVFVVEKNGKKTRYFLADNKVSKGFHKNICKGIHEITVVGVCRKVDGKLVVTAEKLEKVEKEK